MVDEERDQVVDLAVVDRVVVVEHERDLVGHVIEFVEQDRRHGLQCVSVLCRRFGGWERDEPSECCDEVAAEACGIAVAWVERQPRRRQARPLPALEPLGEQRCLAEAGWCRDDGQHRALRVHEPIREPAARYQPPAAARGMQLCTEQASTAVAGDCAAHGSVPVVRNVERTRGRPPCLPSGGVNTFRACIPLGNWVRHLRDVRRHPHAPN